MPSEHYARWLTTYEHIYMRVRHSTRNNGKRLSTDTWDRARKRRSGDHERLKWAEGAGIPTHDWTSAVLWLGLGLGLGSQHPTACGRPSRHFWSVCQSVSLSAVSHSQSVWSVCHDYLTIWWIDQCPWSRARLESAQTIHCTAPATQRRYVL